MNYITFKKMFDYVDRIEKARSHKYIDRRPKKTGKGWYYIYAETFKKPFRALLEIFDIKKERIDKDYEADNIQKDFGVDKNLYASHVLEFFLNREKWHNIFSKKENRQKYTQAVKQSDVEKKAKEKKEKSTEKKKTTTETTKTQKLNRSLMFRIWKRNTPEAEKLLEQDKENINDEDKQQLEDLKHRAWANRAGSYEYTDRNGNIIRGETGLSGGMMKGKYSDEVAELAKMSKEELEAEKKRLEGIVSDSYYFSTRQAASRVGSHVKAMAEAETKLNKVKQVLRRFRKKTQDKQPTGKEGATKESGNEYIYSKKKFSDFIDNFVANGYKSDKSVNLLDSTPSILKEHGFPDNPISITPNIMKKILVDESKAYHGHNLPVEILKDLPNQLEEPVYILKGKDSKKVIVTEHNIENNPVIAILELDRNEGRITVNSVRSLYDKKNKVFAEWINNPNIVEYEDKEKSKALLQSIGLQSPKEVTTPNNENISESNSDVNGEHGNKTAMLGNQNAFKGHLANKETVKFVNTVKGEPYEEWNTDVNKFAVYYNRETGKETGLVMTKDIADIIDSHNEPSVLDWQDNIAEDIHAKYPKIDKQYIRGAVRAIRMGYKNGKKQNIKIIGEQSAESSVNEVKPQTDSEMKKEQENTKKARKEAGLPDINENALDARVSAIDDLSWDPNSENYRYKDTGYIAGARKENALAFLRAAGRNRTRLRETDIDWEGIEENKRAAKEVIIKSNIFGQVDWATLKENGMTGGAAFLIDRIYSQIGKEPTQDSPEARKNYVIAINGLRDRLETAKTVQDVENALNEIKDEMNGEFFSVRNTPEYQRRLAEIGEIRRKVKVLEDKNNELSRVYFNQKGHEDVEINELKRQWLKEHKVIKGNQKHIYGVENNMTPELKADYDSYCEKINAENRKESNRLYEEWMKFRENHCVKNDNQYFFDNHRYTFIHYEIEREYYDKQQELKAYEGKEGAKVLLQNPLYKAWIELGDKFDVIIRKGWKNKTFYKHKADARRGVYDDWEWANKEKIEVSRKGTNRKVQFEFKVAKNYERKGGRNVSVESTEQLKKAFNLRDIQSGNWVLKDPESAKWHVDRIAEGFADLSDVTGIPDNLISLNGRLAMAIGARGVGGAGAAKAHYEAVERVINITKMKGGGSLGHEWFHAFDNMITEAMGGTEGETRSFMTNKFAYLKPKDKELMMKYLKETNLYLKARYKQELDKKNIQIPEKSTEIFQVKVANAFDNLTKVMTEGNSVIKEKITYTHADYEQAVFNIKANATTTTGRKLFEAGNIDNAMNILNGIYTDHKSKAKTKWYKLAAAFYCGNADVERGYARIDMGRRGASFLAGALDLDEGTEKYWSSTHEMAARAFSAYIDDKLRSQGRFNDYLANYTENKYYKDPILGDSFPYPEGEERKRINAAFDELFEIIKSENAIRKALLFEELDHPRGNGGQFIKKFAPDKGGVFGGNERTYNKKKFSDLTDEEKQQKKKQIRSNIVSKVKIGIIHKTEDKRASDVAYEWVDENIKGDIFTVIGNVKFNRKTVKEDLSHGFGQEKLDTLTAVKDVLEKGTYLGYERNFQGETNENHYFAGKIKYGNDEKIVFCRVKDSAGGNSCFYVHEVFTEDEIKSDLPRLGVREADSSRLVGKPLYKFILQTIFNVNDDNIIRKAIFLSKLNHEFCKLVERERRKEAYLDKLGRGYIAYLKKYYPELV